MLNPSKPSFLLRVGDIARTTGKSFHRVCRELGSIGGRRAASLRQKRKQVLARTLDERANQVRRGLLDSDSVPDEIFSHADKVNISRENTERLTRLHRLDGRLANTNPKRAEITSPHPHQIPSRSKSGPISSLRGSA